MPSPRQLDGFVERLARLLAHVFFREIEVEGRERVPAHAPLVIVANHHNSLVDPLLLFAVLPALPRRHLLAAAGLLAASFFYNGLQQPLLHEVLRGEKPPLALQSLLLWFPAVNLLVLGAALAAGREAVVAATDARAA